MAGNFVNGRTGVYGLIGNPVEHSFSPQIHSKIFEYINENGVYVTMPTEKERLRQAVDGAFALGIKGLNVTVPYKTAVMSCIADVDDTALTIGAVNTLKRTEKGFVGYNTDAAGVEYTFKFRGIGLCGKKCLLIGAGGAADAAAYAMLKSGIDRLYIANRTLEKAEAIKKRLGCKFDADIAVLPIDEVKKARDAETIINATTVGFGSMAGFSPLEESFFEGSRAEICMDVIYTPWETEFLRLGAARGLECINGFDMLIYQGAAASEIWHDIKFQKEFLYKLKEELSKIFTKHERGKKNE